MNIVYYLPWSSDQISLTTLKYSRSMFKIFLLRSSGKYFCFSSITLSKINESGVSFHLPDCTIPTHARNTRSGSCFLVDSRFTYMTVKGCREKPCGQVKIRYNYYIIGNTHPTRQWKSYRGKQNPFRRKPICRQYFHISF